MKITKIVTCDICMSDTVIHSEILTAGFCVILEEKRHYGRNEIAKVTIYQRGNPEQIQSINSNSKYCCSLACLHSLLDIYNLQNNTA